MPALFLLLLAHCNAQSYAYSAQYSAQYYPQTSYCYTSSSCPFGQTCIGGVCLQSRGGGGSLQSCSFDYQCGSQQVRTHVLFASRKRKEKFQLNLSRSALVGTA